MRVNLKKACLAVLVTLLGAGYLGAVPALAGPQPGPDEVALVFSVGGDRGEAGSIGTVPGATMVLTNGNTGAVYTQPWATCTVDASGECDIVMPVNQITVPIVLTLTPQSVPGWTRVTPYQAPASVAITSTDALGGQTLRPTAAVQLQRQNPALPANCGANGLKVAIDVDLSGSMFGTPLDTLKTDAKAYVDALTGTNAQIALFTFGTDAPAEGPNNVNRPLTSVTDQAGADQVKAWIDGWTAPGSTNWDAGLAQVARSGINFDMVIFITDGEPNISTTQINLRDDNTASANAIKAMGTRILAVMVGPTSPLAIGYVTDITGSETGNASPGLNDYFLSDWNGVSDLLSALTTVCPAVLHQIVNVIYVDDGAPDPTAPLPGVGTTLLGNDNDPVGFTEQDARDGMPAGYDFVSIDNVGFFDDDHSVDQTITVHVTLTPPPNETITTTRTITYFGAGANTPAAVVQSLDWTVSTDPMTGDKTYTPTGGYPAVTTPTVGQYTPDIASVAVVNPTASDVAPTSIAVTVTYTPPADQSVTTTRTITYVGAGTNTPAAVVQSLDWTISTDPMTGDKTYTPDGSYPEVATPTVGQYASDIASVAAVNPTASGVAPTSIAVTVTYTAPSEQTTTTTRTINYVGAGSNTPPNVVQTLDWNVTIDPMTGDKTYTPTGGYPAVATPTVGQYTPDIASVTAVNPTASGVAPTSIAVTVTYTAPSEQTTTTTRTINYVGAGSNTPAAVVQTLAWTVSTDPMTGDKTYTPTGGYPAVATPTVGQYTPDIATVPAANPTASGVAPTSLTVTVTFIPPADQSVTTTRTITYVGAGANTPDPVIQTLDWTVSTDPMTGDKTYTPTGGYPAVTTPTVGVYQPDATTVMAFSPTARIDLPTALTVTVTYVPPADQTVTTTRTITYVGAGANTPAAVVQSLDWTISTDPMTGDKTYTPTGGYPAVDTPTVGVYQADIATVPAANPTVTTTAPLATTVAVTYTPPADQSVTTTRTITYVGAGSNTPAAVVQTLAWTISTDPMTGDKTYTPTGGYPAVDTPTVGVYQADIATVLAANPTASGVAPASSTVTVTYTPPADQSVTTTRTITYVGAGANTPDPVIQTLDWTVSTDPMTGDKTYTPTGGYPAVDTPTVGVYQPDATTVMAFSPTARIDLPTALTVTVTYVPPADQTVTTTRTITYVGAGADTPDPVIQTLDWTVSTDPMTGDKTYTPDGSYPEVATPTVGVYQPDATIVAAVTPMAGPDVPGSTSLTVTYTAPIINTGGTVALSSGTAAPIALAALAALIAVGGGLALRASTRSTARR